MLIYGFIKLATLRFTITFTEFSTLVMPVIVTRNVILFKNKNKRLKIIFKRIRHRRSKTRFLTYL